MRFPLYPGLMLGIGAMMFVCAAQAGSSLNYSLNPATVNNGGLHTASANYSCDASTGGITGISSSAAHTLKQGFMGQIYEVQSLTITANPVSVVEGLTTQLDGVADVDDETRINLTNNEVQWSVVSGAITGITSNGLATAGEVIVNAPATVRGTWNGASGDFTLTVLDSGATDNTHVTPPVDSVPAPDFTPEVFATTQAGIYQGVLKDDLGQVVGSIIGFKLATKASFSCKVIFNGSTYPLKGSLEADGSFAGEIIRKGKISLAVTLQVGMTDTGGVTLEGTLEGDGISASGFIAQASYTKTNPVPAELVKSYTFLIPAPTLGDENLPEGDGYGTVKISSTGQISAAGKMGDGSSFTHKGYLTEDDEWHFFQLLYKNTGQIAGVLNFREVAGVSDFDGRLAWSKNPNAKDKIYPLGFSLEPVMVGSLFTPPAKGARALEELADQSYNAQLSLVGETLPDGQLVNTMTWLNTNLLSYYGLEKLAAKVTTTTGLVTGSYYDAVTKLKVSFAGAVLQKQGLVAGNFLYNNKSGYLYVEPGTDFSYPGSEGAGALVHLTAPSPLAIPPILAPADFSADAVGSFGGILERGESISGGLDKLVISKTGALSGSVVIDGIAYAFKGVLGSDGAAQIEIVRKGLSSIIADLQLTLATGTTDGFQLTGTFDEDGTVHQLDAQRFAVFPKTEPAAEAGTYTVAMSAPSFLDVSTEPGGDGYASLILATSGKITGAMVLADGSKATFAGGISRNGEWSMHRSLYGKGGGYVAGKLTFRDVSGISDADGQWQWVKHNGIPKTPTYADGFSVTRRVVGSLFTAPAKGQIAFTGLVDEGYNSWLRFDGPDMSTDASITLTSLDRAVTWNAANKILYVGPDAIKISFSTKNGLALGSYVDKANKVSFKFGGALIQKQGLLIGNYSADGQSGFFSMMPR